MNNLKNTCGTDEVIAINNFWFWVWLNQMHVLQNNNYRANSQL